jgi:hypothetical protein
MRTSDELTRLPIDTAIAIAKGFAPVFGIPRGDNGIETRTDAETNVFRQR